MNFTDTEIQYLTHEAQKSGRRVLNEFHRNIHNNIASFRDAYGYVPEATLFANQLRDCAAGVVDAHVERYIEIAKELEKYPDGEDLKTLVNFTQPFITNLLPRYREFAERPFGEDISIAIVEATEKTLEFDLGSIFSERWAPMMTFYMKGRVAEERSNSPTKSNADLPPSSSVQQTYNTFHGPVGAVQQGDKSSSSVAVASNVDKGPDSNQPRWRTQFVIVPLAVALLAFVGVIVAALITSFAKPDGGANNASNVRVTQTPPQNSLTPINTPVTTPIRSPSPTISEKEETKSISRNKTAFFFGDGLSISVNDVRPDSVSMTIGGDGVRTTTVTKGVGPIGIFHGKRVYNITLTEIGFTVSNASFRVKLE